MNVDLLVNDAKAAQLTVFFENKTSGGAKIIHEFLTDRVTLLAKLAELELQLSDARKQHAAAVSNWDMERRELQAGRDTLTADLNELRSIVSARDAQIKKLESKDWLE